MSHLSVYVKFNGSAGIPGDGRCLFRSVVHGACLRDGKPAPAKDLQRELADDLRSRVCSFASVIVACLLSNTFFCFSFPHRTALKSIQRIFSYCIAKL